MTDTKIFEDPDLGTVTIIKKRNVRRVGLRVHPTEGLRLTIPWWCTWQAGIRFFLEKKEWAVRAVLKQKKRLEEEMKDGRAVAVPEEELDALIEEMRKRAKAVLPIKLKDMAMRYGFTYNKVSIKHNRTNWGSCSSLDNINLNLNLVRVPELLADYVILHELAHLRHRNHGPQFHALLEDLCADNLKRYRKKAVSQDETAFLEDLTGKIAATGSHFPVSHVLENEIKKYRLI